MHLSCRQPEIPPPKSPEEETETSGSEGRARQIQGNRLPHLELREEGDAGVEVVAGVGRLEAGEQLGHLRHLRIHRQRRPLEAGALSRSRRLLCCGGDGEQLCLRVGFGSPPLSLVACLCSGPVGPSFGLGAGLGARA